VPTQPPALPSPFPSFPPFHPPFSTSPLALLLPQSLSARWYNSHAADGAFTMQGYWESCSYGRVSAA
jgi:hypothetical protein